jgi:hypothetical protein
MRKKILGTERAETPFLPGALDIAAIAIAWVTSEDADYPIENAFDSSRGPGGSRWVAAQPGEQTLIQEYNFSPPDTTFERDAWSFDLEGVTHFRLWLKPDKGNRPCRASLTSLVLQS